MRLASTSGNCNTTYDINDFPCVRIVASIVPIGYFQDLVYSSLAIFGFFLDAYQLSLRRVKATTG